MYNYNSDIICMYKTIDSILDFQSLHDKKYFTMLGWEVINDNNITITIH